jgi:hypothetical protein
VTLPRTLSRKATVLRVTTSSTSGDEARLDAVMLEPLVSRLALSGDGHSTTLLRSADSRTTQALVRLPGHGRAVVEVYDASARLLSRSTSPARTLHVSVAPGGFTVVMR